MVIRDMATRAPAVKAPTVTHVAPPSHPDLSAYCKDLHDWPRTWMGVPQDLHPGAQIVGCFRPFLEYLVGRDLARTTVRKHADNLWVLGGEIIRDLNDTPSLRKRPVEDLVFEAVDEGGLLPHHHDSQEQLRCFESTCRTFRRFLEQHRPQPL